MDYTDKLERATELVNTAYRLLEDHQTTLDDELEVEEIQSTLSNAFDLLEEVSAEIEDPYSNKDDLAAHINSEYGTNPKALAEFLKQELQFSNWNKFRKFVHELGDLGETKV